eukprot:scpid13546/ scgid1982/ 
MASTPLTKASMLPVPLTYPRHNISTREHPCLHQRCHSQLLSMGHNIPTLRKHHIRMAQQYSICILKLNSSRSMITQLYLAGKKMSSDNYSSPSPLQTRILSASLKILVPVTVSIFKICSKFIAHLSHLEHLRLSPFLDVQVMFNLSLLMRFPWTLLLSLAPVYLTHTASSSKPCYLGVVGMLLALHRTVELVGLVTVLIRLVLIYPPCSPLSPVLASSLAKQFYC